jgi:UDP-glucose 4-epimerase
MNILVTGGLGYIGSHTILELSSISSKIHIIDNLCNSHKSTFSTLQQELPSTILHLHEGDISNFDFLSSIFPEDLDVVFHFAAQKSCLQSDENQSSYNSSNLEGTQNILRCMERFNVKKLIFSSSASVYKQSWLPVKENDETSPLTTYSKTKLANEKMIELFSKKHPDFQSIIFRYFNPAGAHYLAKIGENGKIENGGLFEGIRKVITGKVSKFKVYGNCFNTFDGSAVRDFVHVHDLARANVMALNVLTPGMKVFNLGSGKGTSVLQIVEICQKVSGVQIEVEVKEGRVNELEFSLADLSKVLDEIPWKPLKDVESICRDFCMFVKISEGLDR